MNTIVMHEYPVFMVDHIHSRDFMNYLNPSFKMISQNTLKTNTMKVFESKGVILNEMLVHNSNRVASTMDMWTTSNKKRDMVINSHFVDEKWVSRSRILNLQLLGILYFMKIIFMGQLF